jgi:hypothetical protein
MANAAQPTLLSDILFFSISLGLESCTGQFFETRTSDVQHQIRPITRDNIKMKSAPAEPREYLSC